jgi:dTDP-4-dehydrorhamnose reductase
MKILLFGAKGNLGTVFLEKSTEYSEHSFIGWDKDDIDVTDKGLLEKKISEIKPDIIMNCVAFNDVDRCEAEEEAAEIAERLNQHLVQDLAEVAMEFNCVLIHFSSDYVFSGDNKTGYDEGSEPNPINQYGDSKLKGERELIKLSGKGLQYYLIRTSRLFGTKGSGTNAKPSFFEIIYKAAEQKKQLSIVADEYSAFTYTPDLVQATLELIESNDGFGIYHLINEGKASWYEAACYFFKQMDSSVVLQKVTGEFFDRPARRPLYSQLLNTKRPKLRSWQEAVDEYCRKL